MGEPEEIIPLNCSSGLDGTTAKDFCGRQNGEKSDEELAEELVELAKCGADLCDVMGDYFDRQPDEVAVDETAINKQMKLINRIHEKGQRCLCPPIL